MRSRSLNKGAPIDGMTGRESSMNNLQKTRALAGLRAPFLAKILQAPGRMYMYVEKGSIRRTFICYG